MIGSDDFIKKQLRCMPKPLSALPKPTANRTIEHQTRGKGKACSSFFLFRKD